MPSEKDFNNAISFLLRNALNNPDPWLSENKDLHRGGIAFLLGGGPSLENFDGTRLDGQIVMSTNSSYLIPGLKPTYYISVSRVFWQGHKNSITSIPAKRIFLPQRLRGKLGNENVSWLFEVELEDHALLSTNVPYSFSHDPSQMVFLGGSVIGVGLQVLHWLGIETVVLLGVDHDWGIDPQSIAQSGQLMNPAVLADSYAMPGNYPANINMHLNYHGAERAYELANEAYIASGRRIVNASKGSKLRTFEMVDLEDYLDDQGSTKA